MNQSLIRLSKTTVYHSKTTDKRLLINLSKTYVYHLKTTVYDDNSYGFVPSFRFNVSLLTFVGFVAGR